MFVRQLLREERTQPCRFSLTSNDRDNHPCENKRRKLDDTVPTIEGYDTNRGNVIIVKSCRTQQNSKDRGTKTPEKGNKYNGDNHSHTGKVNVWEQMLPQ